MICNINWNILTRDEWDVAFSKAYRANLLQNYGYARTMCALQNQSARWGIIEIDGNQAGMVQILEAGILKNAIHAVILDRSPIWFENYGHPEHIKAFFETFNRQFPRRWGRKRRIIPKTDIDITPFGFEKIRDGYQTIWLDLRPDIETLRANLKKNWRASLQKAEKQDLSIIWDEKGKYLAWLLSSYMKDRATKGYDGASLQLLKALTQNCSFLIGRVEANQKPIAGILIFKHGPAATYQLGFSTSAGRDKTAHHIVLWQAIERLKIEGIKDFDLGGINDETAKGVKRFKEGLGGSIFANAGLYR